MHFWSVYGTQTCLYIFLLHSSELYATADYNKNTDGLAT